MPKPSDLLQGTLDLLILKTLAREPLHGWGIARRIQLLSGDVLAVGQGSLYPALHRLEHQGWISRVRSLFRRRSIEPPRGFRFAAPRRLIRSKHCGRRRSSDARGFRLQAEAWRSDHLRITSG